MQQVQRHANFRISIEVVRERGIELGDVVEEAVINAITDPTNLGKTVYINDPVISGVGDYLAEEYVNTPTGSTPDDSGDPTKGGSGGGYVPGGDEVYEESEI